MPFPPRSRRHRASFRAARAWFAALALFTSAAPFGGAPALGADNDAAVLELVTTVFEGDVAKGDFEAALDKLRIGREVCAEGACSGSVRAKLEVAIGTVLAGGLGRPDEARRAFRAALAADPDATLAEGYGTPEVRAAWEAAKAGDATGARVDVEYVRAERGCDDARRARGWRSGEAACLFRAAEADRKAGRAARCAEAAQASAALEDRPSTRMLAASCAEKAGALRAALEDYRNVAKRAGRFGLPRLAAEAKKRAERLDAAIPRVALILPEGLALDEARVDGEIAPRDGSGALLVDPGRRRVSVAGKLAGRPYEAEREIVADVGERVEVEFEADAPPPARSPAARRARQDCLEAAKTPEARRRCGEPARGERNGGASRAYRFGTGVAGYRDTNEVDVLAPRVFVGVSDPEAGLRVDASLEVDVISSASVDVVSMASPRWSEVRHAPSLAASARFGATELGARGSVSVEPDYVARSAGLRVALGRPGDGFFPALGYDFSFDTLGRTGTSFDVFSRSLSRHAAELSSSFVLGPRTVLFAALGLRAERGDPSSPYRYVPLFRPEIAERVRPGQDTESVNAFRAPERALERLPDERTRASLSLGLARRLGIATLRAEASGFLDTWSVGAGAADARLFVDLGRALRIWPHGRFEAQSGASFWQLAYPVAPTPAGFALPAFRTGRRDLGPLFAATGGAGARLALGDAVALRLEGDVVYTRFLEHLFLLQRMSYVAVTSLEVEVE